MRVGKINRERKRNSYTPLTWCPACDGALTGGGDKCPVCGLRKVPKRNKKRRPIDKEIDDDK